MAIGGQGRAIAFAPDAPRIAAIGNLNTLRVWDVPSPAPVVTVEQQGIGVHAALCFEDRDTISAPVCCLRFGPDGTDLLTSSTDGTVSLWKL